MGVSSWSRKLAAQGAFFSGGKRGHAGRFFWSRKQGVLGVFVAAEQPDLYADWVRSSSICFFLFEARFAY